MTSAFETPHPTLEASSEIYKLPSTKPIPSPTPFSPVPITAPAHCLDLSTRPYFVPTTSETLKENVGSSKSIPQRQSSKTLSSFTLTSDSVPASRNTRENGNQTRSPSRSSNSASSRSRSRNQTRFSKFESKFKPNTTINDPSKRHSSKPKQTAFSRLKSRKRNKFVLPVSNAEQVLLASPFASRAPSPTECSNSDFAKSGLFEPMGPPALAEPKLVTHPRRLSKVYVDLSAPSHSGTQNKSFQNRTGLLSQVCDVFSSPEKLGTRKRSSAKLPGRTNENNFSWKSRRPSAPSSLQRPPKPVGKTHIPEKRAEKAGYKQFKEENGINCHTTEQPNPAPLRSVDHIKEFSNKLSVELNANPDPFFWMQERSAVDFNRPPSQLSFHLPSGFNPAADEGEADGVFWSSEEDNDVNDDQLNHFQATNSAWLNSTPYKNVIARRLSVPILEVPSMTLADPRDSSKASMTMDKSSKNGASVAVEDNDKNGEDMEITTPLECGDIPENDSMSLQDHTPWIMDSIISPPTAYLERTKPAANVEEQLVPQPGPTSPSSSMVPTQTGILSSPFRSSYAESTSSIVESSSLGLHEPTAGANQEHKGEVTVTNGTQSQGPSQRRRSGTILAARNGTSIARRTRTGTIVGPSTIGRIRSGTIVAKVKVPEQNVAVDGVSGKKGVRSTTGSVTGLEPMKISDVAGAEEEVHARVDGELIQVENNGSSIEEVNEAECYVDSLYLTSSPDPINFLTGAKIDGDESELVVAVGEWQVADEPPSPEMRRSKKRIQTPRGVGGRSITRRFKLKGNRKNCARFLGVDDQVEGYECDDPEGSNPNFEDGLNGMSDDELLLVEGQSRNLFS